MASFTVPCPKVCSAPMARLGSTAQTSQPQQHLLSFHNCLNRCPIPSLQISGLQSPIRKQSAAWKVQAQPSEITEKSPNSVPINNTKSEDGSPEEKDESTEKLSRNIPDASSISAFIAQVSDLVKLVDSRDIVELQMKQLDLELVIRKKEALEKPAPQAPVAPPPAHYPYAMLPPQQAAAPAAAPAPASPPALASPPAAAAPALPAPAKPSTSSHPPLKSPMAGTFYRSPAPGEPPFFKVGDKVQKGQVICIIEAMKLMNEIEADQSGTVAEILAEDAKPVSVDTPLFVIVP